MGSISDDPYVDMPLWADDTEPGICVECGAITEDADSRFCDACVRLIEGS